MHLVLNTYGCYLRKREGCFIIKDNERVSEISAKKVRSIMITTSAFVSTDAIKLALEHNIDIIFLDEFGNPYGRVWHSKLGSTTLIRRRQLEFALDERGVKLVVGWIANKFSNQIEFLHRLKNTRPLKAEMITEVIKSIKEIKSKVTSLNGPLEEIRKSIMGYEGAAGKIYFDTISAILPERYKFQGRTRQPAKDEFNCLLNYAYGILYSLVEKACLIAGLDPFVGFIHTDDYNKKSLVFDLIENFRIYAERTVVLMFSKREVKQDYFDKIHQGMKLNKKGKAVLIETLNKILERPIRYRGRNIKIRDVIQFECHHLANQLIA